VRARHAAELAEATLLDELDELKAARDSGQATDKQTAKLAKVKHDLRALRHAARTAAGRG
jgi:predicted RNA-binding protein associated with RNAse of E/G family